MTWPGPLCGVSRLAGAGLDQHARPGEVLPGDAEEESSKKYLTKRNLFFQSVVNRGLKAGIAEVGLVKKQEDLEKQFSEVVTKEKDNSTDKMLEEVINI